MPLCTWRRRRNRFQILVPAGGLHFKGSVSAGYSTALPAHLALKIDKGLFNSNFTRQLIFGYALLVRFKLGTKGKALVELFRVAPLLCLDISSADLPDEVFFAADLLCKDRHTATNDVGLVSVAAARAWQAEFFHCPANFL